MGLDRGNVEEIRKRVESGEGVQGAAFWAYVSPSHETEKRVTSWLVKIEHKESDWVGEITSKNPTEILQTPGLSGEFNVIVDASGPDLRPNAQLKPLPESNADIGCNSNCHAMVGVVASEDGMEAFYWTVWDAFC